MTAQKTVNLPHDYVITQPRDKNAPGGARAGFFAGTNATYSKFLKMDDSAHTILDIDGAYMCTRIYFNENLLDMHPNGYMPYLVDLSERVRANRNNKIMLRVSDLQPSCRWYSGSGVYRDVFLWTGGKIRIEPWDLYVTTERIGQSDASVAVRTQISADFAAHAELVFDICDADGNRVLSDTCAVDLQEGKNDAVFDFTIENPRLWDCENPHLYALNVSVRHEGKTEDEFASRFGIRTISVDPKNGLLLNGKPLLLRGVCIHHDHAVLGSAEYPAAVRRKLGKLQSAGFNAIRTAHCPPSLAVLEACDEMGIVIMDEAFDMWNEPKTDYDYSLWFRDWWARDISYMVRRDRSHPCVFSYSIGNEIPERFGRSDGALWAEKLANEIRKYDSTRPVTAALNGTHEKIDPNAPADYIEDNLKEFGPRITFNHTKLGMDGTDAQPTNFGVRSESTTAALDMVGYNYLYLRYAADRKTHPNRVIWGSENHALHIYDSWKEVCENPNVFSDFTWTAFDNLGEAGTGKSAWGEDDFVPIIRLYGYPWRTCFQGDFDLCGYRRPQSYFREVVWKDITAPHFFTTHPKHNDDVFTGTEWHWYDVHETRTFDATYIGTPVKTEVYTTADEICFLLNGKEICRAVPEKAVATAYIPYAPGELSAIAYRGGKEECRFSLTTVGAPYRLQVTAERETIAADCRDLCYFDISAVDQNGNLVTNADCEITAQVFGGNLLGIFSGNPCNEDVYGSNQCHLFEGRAVAIVNTDDINRIKLFVRADGIKSGIAECCAVSTDDADASK